jgi:hypothetical protein
MDPQSSAPPPDAMDRELEQLLREAAAERERPDRRRPRGNQDLSVFDAERGREQLERVLGW